MANKNVINELAQKMPGEDFPVFCEQYHMAMKADNLPHDAVRQAFDKYKKACRKLKRTQAAKPGTVGPDRIRR